MANAGKNAMGKGGAGKKSGSGAMTPESTADDILGENQILSNRDKVVTRTEERGLDTQGVRNDQRQDNARNRQTPADATAERSPRAAGSPEGEGGGGRR